MFQTDNFKKILERLKKSPYFVPVLLVIAGLLLLLCFSGTGESTKASSVEVYDPYDYVDTLEKNLEKSICKFSGVDSCSVMITLASLENNEYLENSSVSSSNGEATEQYTRQEEYLVINEDGNDSVIVSSKKTPKICGALIVYQGSADIETKKNNLDAASTVLGLQSNKVCVVVN